MCCGLFLPTDVMPTPPWTQSIIPMVARNLKQNLLSITQAKALDTESILRWKRSRLDELLRCWRSSNAFDPMTSAIPPESTSQAERRVVLHGGF